MLAAEERGWVTCPMIGFDPSAWSKILGLSERYTPLMNIVIGKAAAGNPPRKGRLGTADVLRFNKGDF
jgi:putative NAD(P)H nitroreductase